jgi:nucleotide-binding universal stress UspA family protein
MTTSQASIAVSYKTILLATDFLPTTEAALPYVLSLARSFDATVLATHAVPLEPVAGLAPLPPPSATLDYEWQDAQQAMQKYEQNHPFTGLRHEFVLERGEPRAVIEDVVERRNVDLVVLGTHGRHGFGKLFAGSVAEEVLRSIPCPVLTVGPEVEPVLDKEWKPRRILFATEFAEGSVHALPHAIAIADANEAELLLLHAVPLVPWEQQSEMATLYQQRLRKLVPEDPERRCSIDVGVCFDLAAQGILATAKEKNSDLIVMGVRHARLPKLDAHLLGTTSYEVISNAHCPVLTVCG